VSLSEKPKPISLESHKIFFFFLVSGLADGILDGHYISSFIDDAVSYIQLMVDGITDIIIC